MRRNPRLAYLVSSRSGRCRLGSLAVGTIDGDLGYLGLGGGSIASLAGARRDICIRTTNDCTIAVLFVHTAVIDKVAFLGDVRVARSSLYVY